MVFDTLFSGPEQLAASMLDAIQPPGSILHGDPFAGLQVAYDELQASATVFHPAQPGHGLAAAGRERRFAALSLNDLRHADPADQPGRCSGRRRSCWACCWASARFFIAMLLFDATRGVFEGWLRAAVAFALAPLMAILGLVVELTMIGPDLVRLADLRSQGLVDVAPANAIFLLVLISTGVSLALAAAVGVIAFGLRLPVRPASRRSECAPRRPSLGRRTRVGQPRAWPSCRPSPGPRSIVAAASRHGPP